ncbi:MAG: FAD-dependent oxidoreductase [Planctomycetes bacterium]|nr:FAD-dependent oxidoreductase [Planctomycetota bacterium]
MPGTVAPEIARLRKLRREAQERRPAREVRICATGCRALGALEVHAAFERELAAAGLAEKVALVKTGCQGICAGAPVISIEPDGILYLSATPADVPEIVRTTLLGAQVVGRLCFQGPQGPIPKRSDVPFFARQTRRVLDRCGRIDPASIEQALAAGAYEMLEKVLTEMTPEDVIGEISASGLRGRGGAGFPTGKKWAITRAAAGSPKYLVCNGDEGDPGAFMDRAVLEGDPHSVLEGMLIAAYAIGARHGCAYIRAEYPIAIEHIRLAIGQAAGLGLLGENVLGTGFSFDVQIKAGAGAFVCGEETALMASIEGRRGCPRPRPPFPAQSGLWGKPTCINNVETLANLPAILRAGAREYAKLGTPTSKGTKIFALAGKVNNTGLVEVPMGATLRQIVHEIGGDIPKGRAFKAAQMGGPSGGCVPARYLDLPIDYESVKEVGAIMGSGGLIVLDETTCMVDIARYFMDFCAKESCGKCPPCRIGTRRMLEILDRICAGKGRIEDIDKLETLALQVKKNALCGLGQTAPNPVLSTLRHFREEYIEHIMLGRCRAAACSALVEAPCQHACPAGVDVPDYLALAAEERNAEALTVVQMRNPFASVCGRVCERPCELYCRRTDVDEPLAIRDIKRLATDAVAAPWRPPEAWLERQTSHRVAVVGAGPAGLSCAYFLRFFGHHATVFEEMSSPGGMILVGIPEYRLPAERLKLDIDFILSTGIELKLGSKVRSPDDLLAAGYEAVFLAVGAHQGAPLRGISTDTPGVLDGVKFLRDRRLGGATQQLCRTVAIIGGGNVAVDAARVARRLGADVTIVYRRSRAEMPAYPEEIEGAAEEGVRIEFLTQPVGLITGADGRVKAIKCARMELGSADESGRRQPVPVAGSEFDLPCEAVISAVGQVVAAESAWGLKLTDEGTYKVDPVTLATGRQPVFAGGDCVRGPASVIQAVADGQRAACAIDRLLGGSGELPDHLSLSSRRFAVEGEPAPARPRPPMTAPAARAASFGEVAGTLDRAVAVGEARRCLRCDLERAEELKRRRGERPR